MNNINDSFFKNVPSKQKNKSGRLEDLTAYVKLFTPWSNWTWYVCEYDLKNKICFGYVQGLENEAGYFSLDELKSVKGPYGLSVEIDISFSPKKLKDIPELSL